jgi:hypothetical protein
VTLIYATVGLFVAATIALGFVNVLQFADGDLTIPAVIIAAGSTVSAGLTTPFARRGSGSACRRRP